MIILDKETAESIKQQALKATEELSKIINITFYNKNFKDDKLIIKKGVGLAIGTIQMDILEHIYKLYPEMDHLKGKY